MLYCSLKFIRQQGEYMKFTKMSLVAALLIGSSAFAIDNVKVSGDAKLYYATDDATTNGIGGGAKSDSLFDGGSSAGQAALGLGVTTDLAKGISAGVHLTALSTLGLEGQLVNNVWEGTNATQESWWFDEAWVAATLGKTTVKVGRMELDTPYVFSEKWSIATNTFGAAVLINQDVPGTTLVGAYVGQGNGSTLGLTAGNHHGVGAAGIANVVAAQGNGITKTNGDSSNFSQFYNGAYAVAAINNSWKPLTVQAWYFGATHAAQAYWLQADLDTSALGVKGLTAGVQYTYLNLQKELLNTVAPVFTSNESNDATAVMLGYAGMKDIATIKVAYSQTGKNSTSGKGAGMNLAGTGQSKLYTEAWWNYGYVTRADTQAYNVTIESPVNGMFDLGLYYTGSTTSDNGIAGTPDVKMNELTVTASKSVGPLDATLAYINTNADDKNSGNGYNTIQAYLTLNF